MMPGGQGDVSFAVNTAVTEPTHPWLTGRHRKITESGEEKACYSMGPKFQVRNVAVTFPIKTQ